METENAEVKVEAPVVVEAAPAVTHTVAAEASTQNTVLWVLGSVFGLVVLVGAGMWLYQQGGRSNQAMTAKEAMAADAAAKKVEAVPAAKEVLTPTAAAAAAVEAKTPNTAGRKAADDFATSFETNHSGDATVMDSEKDSEASDVDSLGNNNSLHSAYDETSL